jgi:prepilin-type N-terminal cleavage/methylation domain-containing protein
MRMLRFKNIFQKNKGSTTQSGFTLVEISIVMIIIGLLIGGIFSGMKLVDNAEVQKTIQDLKAIQSSTLTFRDTYRALPGDLRNPATQIPNCTLAPCATAGNGNRQIGVGFNQWSHTFPVTVTDERFTFWNHLSAANLLSLGTKNVLDLQFGEGQPESPLDGGYVIQGAVTGDWGFSPNPMSGHMLAINGLPDQAMTTPETVQQFSSISCSQAEALDRKMDDGKPVTGNVLADCLILPRSAATEYGVQGSNAVYFLLGI